MSNSIPWLPSNPIDVNEGRVFAKPQSSGTDKAAVTAFVYGLVGLVVAFVPPVVALFLGLGAKRNIKASEDNLGGAGLANAAIVLGAVMLTINTLITLLLFL